MKWISPGCTVLVSLAGYALLCWEAGRPQPAPSREIVISLPEPIKKWCEAFAEALVRKITEDQARNDQAQCWSPVFGVLLGGITAPGFWLAVCATGDDATNRGPL